MKEFYKIMESIMPGDYRSTGMIYKSKVYQVELYEHLEAFKEIFTGQLLQTLKEDLKNLDQHYMECEEAEGHPEWHSYEMHKGGIYNSIMKEFYKDGGIRFYIDSKRMSGGNLEYTITIEGFTNGLQNVASLIYDLRKREDVAEVKVNNQIPF